MTPFIHTCKAVILHSHLYQCKLRQQSCLVPLTNCNPAMAHLSMFTTNVYISYQLQPVQQLICRLIQFWHSWWYPTPCLHTRKPSPHALPPHSPGPRVRTGDSAADSPAQKTIRHSEQGAISTTIFGPQIEFDEKLFRCNSIPGYTIATKFCTYHDSTAVVACAKFCNDRSISIWMRTK